MRRILNQAANAAVKARGTIFAVVYRRICPTPWTCPSNWRHDPSTLSIDLEEILHERVRYEERGPAVSDEAKKVRARKMIRELRTLGYHVEWVVPAPSSSPA